MIIRSQDKKTLTNFHQITDMGVKKDGSVFLIKVYYPFSVNDDYSSMRIAAYSTEEKAIKVLDMIQKAYNSIETMKIDKGAWRDNHYFEMPQNSEV